jgi:hypothetical protein
VKENYLKNTVEINISSKEQKEVKEKAEQY